ncbi:LapD/MoxY N-terminal periplasmic domain-containing protein [Chromatiaceae bacterium AAb-1]|nr:LapD/MoxY N-terminal periplasmic domain-containing protein [Chromatiaceae bacterium AAb-1]
MSLIKQLWIAVVMLISGVFVSSLLINSYSTRQYFAEQLRLKNIDNASVLALSMSQLEKDPVLLELMIAAQFDTGHYQRITLVKPDGRIYLQKSDEGEAISGVPSWFIRLMPLQVEPGIAQVQDNWHQFGTLYVESHNRFVYHALWQSSVRLFFWCLLVVILAGIGGSLLLKWIIRPLHNVVVQAEAIGQQRFISSAEPATCEFRQVVRAMNTLSDKVRQMLETESGRLAEIRHRYQHDALTALANREYFLNILDATLGSKDSAARHALFLIRVTDLKRVNQQLGHQKTDALLQEIAAILRHLIGKMQDSFTQANAGRLNGTDFTLLLTNHNSLWQCSIALEQQLQALSQRYQDVCLLSFPVAGTYFYSHENRTDVMARLDNLLAVAEHREITCSELYVQGAPAERVVFSSAEQWRTALADAMQPSQLQLQYYPVIKMDGTLLHQEAMVRLMLAGEVRSAGYFIAWARRLGLLPRLDIAVIRQVLQELSDTDAITAIAVNLSVETLKDAHWRNQLEELLTEHRAETAYLWLEFNEQAVMSELSLFRAFAVKAKAAGCKLGLQAAGNHVDIFTALQTTGLDYMKLDAALIRGLQVTEQDHRMFVQGLCTLGHSIGLQMIAEGVSGQQTTEQLQLLGLDAVTGPAVRMQ